MTVQVPSVLRQKAQVTSWSLFFSHPTSNPPASLAGSTFKVSPESELSTPPLLCGATSGLPGGHHRPPYCSLLSPDSLISTVLRAASQNLKSDHIPFFLSPSNGFPHPWAAARPCVPWTHLTPHSAPPPLPCGQAGDSGP